MKTDPPWNAACCPMPAAPALATCRGSCLSAHSPWWLAWRLFPPPRRRRTGVLRAHRRSHGRGAAVRERFCAAGPGRGPALPLPAALLPAGKPGWVGGVCVCVRVCRSARCDCVRLPAALPPPQDAAAALAGFDLLLLLDARRPVANFGYDGAPSQLVALPVSWRMPAPAGATTAGLLQGSPLRGRPCRALADEGHACLARRRSPRRGHLKVWWCRSTTVVVGKKEKGTRWRGRGRSYRCRAGCAAPLSGCRAWGTAPDGDVLQSRLYSCPAGGVPSQQAGRSGTPALLQHCVLHSACVVREVACFRAVCSPSGCPPAAVAS